MKEIKDQEVAEVIKSEKLTIIDCWAPWCGPCRAMAPKLEELNNENSATTEIVKLNVDENPNTPAQHNIRGIPTLLIFKNGNLVDTLVGNQSKENIQALIDKHSKNSGDGLFGDDF